MLASVMFESLPTSCLVLQGVLMWGSSSLPVPFLVDSGADDSFIDEQLAKQAGLPLVALPEPRTVFNLNGRPLAHATQLRHRVATRSSSAVQPSLQTLETGTQGHGDLHW